MSYIDPLLKPKTRKAIVTRLLKAIRSKKQKIHYVVGMGHSGVIVASYVSDALKIPLIIVRKNAESSHGNPIEIPAQYPTIIRNYIIVDDGICTGNTIKSIVNAIDTEFIDKFHCVGLFLYAQITIKRWLYEDKSQWNKMINRWKFPVYVVK